MVIWWKKVLPVIQNAVSGKIIQFTENISAFNDIFQPGYSESTPIPQMNKTSNIPIVNDTLNNTNVEFDTAYYYILWDKFINEYQMDELDSLSIDSIIKAEMKNNPANTSTEEESADANFSLKKDELLYVTALKPLPNKPELFKEQDSLDFSAIEHSVFTIEFWKSPLNYQGVKTTGNIITVFGISDFENINLLFLSKNHFALKIKNRMYALRNDGNFYNLKELIVN